MYLKYFKVNRIRNVNAVIYYDKNEEDKIFEVIRLLIRMGWMTSFFIDNGIIFTMKDDKEYKVFKKDYYNAKKVVEAYDKYFK